MALLRPLAPPGHPFGDGAAAAPCSRASAGARNPRPALVLLAPLASLCHNGRTSHEGGARPPPASSQRVALAAGWRGFEFVAQLSYKEWEQDKFADCGLEWWEKIVGVDTYIIGWERDTWRDLAGETSLAVNFNWSLRKVSPPKPTTATIYDYPGLTTIPGRTATRTLDFKIIVTSAKGCGCPKESLTTTATQVLTMENGQVNFDKSSFTFKNPE